MGPKLKQGALYNTRGEVAGYNPEGVVDQRYQTKEILQMQGARKRK